MCADKTRQLVESANAIAIRSGSEEPGLFHTPDGVAYANVYLKGHRETNLIRSKEFCQRVAAKYFETTGGRAAATDLSAAIDIIEAKALQESPQREVYIRVATLPGQIYVDLANERAKWPKSPRTAGG